MNWFQILLVTMCLLAWSCSSKKTQEVTESTTSVSMKIMFGSCANQDKDLPLLGIAAKQQPDAFIFLGDNIYGDTYVMDTLRAKYSRLASKKEFQDLNETSKVFAVWDDHDFGWNDIGKHYPFKKESESIFLDFWQVPETSERRKHAGIYGSEILQKGDKSIQIILLDTRYFKDDLVHRTKSDTAFKNDYMPNPIADSTFLGEAQWQWLERELQKPADFRLVSPRDLYQINQESLGAHS